MTGSYKALTGAPKTSLSGVWRDGHRDMYNNHIGNQIAQFARKYGLPKEALGYLVADAVKSGQLVADEFNDKRVGLLSFKEPAYKGPSVATKGHIQKMFGVNISAKDIGDQTKATVRDPTRIRSSREALAGNKQIAELPAVPVPAPRRKFVSYQSNG